MKEFFDIMNNYHIRKKYYELSLISLNKFVSFFFVLNNLYIYHWPLANANQDLVGILVLELFFIPIIFQIDSIS